MRASSFVLFGLIVAGCASGAPNLQNWSTSHLTKIKMATNCDELTRVMDSEWRRINLGLDNHGKMPEYSVEVYNAAAFRRHELEC